MKKPNINNRDQMITLCIIAGFVVVLYFILENIGIILDWVNGILGVVTPFAWAFGFAFFLTPVMNFFEFKVFNKWNIKTNIKHNSSAIIAVLIGIAFVAALVSIVMPQFVESLASLAKNSIEYLADFKRFLNNFVSDNHLSNIDINSIVGSSGDIVNTVISLLGNLNVDQSVIADYSFKVVQGVFDAFVAIAGCLYMLIDKEKFLRQIKKINYAILPEKPAKYMHHFVILARNIFYDFIVGKAIDSTLVGITCYIGMNLLGLHYAGLLSVLIGITDMIPVFGPFMGAIPGMFILLIVNPIESLIFAIFLLVLQQIDGNVIAPLILGDKLGLPSFWILFSVTMGGTFFGIVGMFIGVPLFALIYYVIREFVDKRLKEKQIKIE